MAIVTIPAQEQTILDGSEIAQFLETLGIDYERWKPAHPVAADAPPADILAVYAAEIAELKARGGYVAADVIDVNQSTPGLDAMLAKFNREHWHDEDEVRFIISGRGLFHIHSEDGAVVAIEVENGDLLRVPKGVRHWFNLCSDRSIRAIRLFQDPAGWTPQYTESGVDGSYDPVCLGHAYVPALIDA